MADETFVIYKMEVTATHGISVEVPLKEYHGELPDSLRYELALLKVKLSGLPADAIDKLP